VLTRLLEVEYRCNSLLFELSNNVVFLDEPIRETLRTDDYPLDPIGVETNNGRIFTESPILVLALSTSTEPAMNFGFIFEASTSDTQFFK